MGELELWIHEATETLDWRDGLREQRFGLPVTSNLKSMVNLLLFSYATGMFSSEEIVRNCRTDAFLSRLSNDKIPFPQELEGLRRAHRGLLAGSLLEVFFRAVSARFDVDESELSMKWRHRLFESAMERLDTARHVNRDDDYAWNED
jgi:hypothetical protein